MQHRESDNDISMGTSNGQCISDDLLARFLAGEISALEKQTVQKHLNNCSFCFNVVATVMRNEHMVLSQEDEQELEKSITISPDAQADKLLSIYTDEQAETRRVPERAHEPVRSRQRPAPPLDRIFWKIWRPAVAFAAIVLIIGGSYFGRQYYRTTFRIGQAKNMLLQNYQVYMSGKARLSGGYPSSGISTLMAGDQPSPENAPYLKEAASLVEKATASGSAKHDGQLLLAQIYIISQQYEKAETIFSQMSAGAQLSPQMLNDLGVLAFDKKDWAKAAQYFTDAIRADASFKEGYYNLALVKAELGQTNDAITLLENYLSIEKDEGWRNAAMSFANDLKKSLPK